ncbi:hypothetical protein BKA62DRAFT_687863 [Auriculariales sp. MPI-PUGE-AT-0066]|nr:hypothetical protein BKA62DRAFT_687863 [Auriculariales sp. MPI-PUGE-AT-0066]
MTKGSSYSRVEQDDESGSRANGHYRDDDSHERLPPPRGPVRKQRGCMNRQIYVGLITVAVVIGIGILSSLTGPDRPWNDSTGHGASQSQPPPQSQVNDVLDTGPVSHPSKGSSQSSKLMSQAEWQALEDEKFNPKNFVLGAPTKKFRDNLRPDVNYMSGWIAGGWTNDFMTYINLIYMAYITQPRVPIIGQFHPTHVGEEAGFLHFGDVFDVQRLSKLIRMPVLEWRDVKDVKSKEFEEIGCWSAWSISGPDDGKARHSFIPEVTYLDVSYTDAPKETKMSPEPANWFIKIWPLARLAYPRGRAQAIHDGKVQSGPNSPTNHTHPPDEHLVCYDFLYFAGVTIEDEWFHDFSPVWREIGQHVHWTPRIENLAKEYLQRHFKVASIKDIPDFIVIHSRRADFKGGCREESTKDECFATIHDYEVRVREMKAMLKKKHGKDITHVVMTSDEQDPKWWTDIKAKGWTEIDHAGEKTEQKYGAWYPVFIDAAIQSMAKGFIGTAGSTMSMVAARRVEDWNNGISVYIEWGEPGADKHDPPSR